MKKKKTVKRKRPPNKLRAIKGNPMFGKRIEKSGKGKGSYTRKNTRMDDYRIKFIVEKIKEFIR